MKNETKEIIDDVRTYLEYQKMMGIKEVPKCHSTEVPQCRSAAVLKSKTLKNKTSTLQNSNTGALTSTLQHFDTGALDVIRSEIGDCKRCKLCKQRTNIVFGVGNPNAELMFIGEGPGADEDAQGEPFVGRAGQLLNKIIIAMGLKRSDVYIGNILKCRPPNNRNPEPDEMEACMPFILKQIAAIKPKVIVCLGAIAAKALLKTEAPISKIRGKLLDWPSETTSETGFLITTSEKDEIIKDIQPLKVVPTYHPAFLLRNPNMKRPVWEDMQKVMELLNLKQ